VAGVWWLTCRCTSRSACLRGWRARRCTPTCSRHGIGADLAADWYGKLQKAGFDPRQPSVWLVEGLLMYLADEVADRILAELTRASAPHSQLLVEHLDTRMMTERGRTIQDAVEAQNTVLVSARRHRRLAGWHGWQATVHAGSDLAIGYCRVVPEIPAGWLACATLQGSGRA
jgi:methyltransferase (TIGR00027 family)